MIHLRTRLCDILDLTYPIIQAGMAGGPTTVELVASASNAGALGTLGAAYMSPNEIRTAIVGIRERTDKPIAVNLFCTEWIDRFDGVAESQKLLNAIRTKLGLEHRNSEVSTKDIFDEQFEVLLEERVPVISTAFGVLPGDKVASVKERNIKLVAMATTVKEAQIAEDNGADIIVAQGSDAGGHRGTFEIGENALGALIGTFSLVPQIVDAVSVPVVAAGGIMDGRGLAAALALGAQGIQLGTAFLTTKESGAHHVYKKALLDSTEESTVITRVFSGRPARAIRNAFIRTYEDSAVPPAQFPTQNSLTKDIRKEAVLQNNPDYMSLWAGQGTRLLKSGISAQQLIEDIVAGAKRIVG